MEYKKYYILAFGAIIGSEIVYWCLNYLLKRQKNKAKTDRNKIYTKVIFFPDEGLISHRAIASCQGTEKEAESAHNWKNSLEHPDKILRQDSDMNANVRSDFLSLTDWKLLAKTNNHSNVSQMNDLKDSTSLVQMVNVILSAKRSVLVCVYVFTCKPLVDALIHVKQHNVEVHVLMEAVLADACLDAIRMLRKHNIQVQLSQTAYMMHHKFAVIDGPLQEELLDVTALGSFHYDKQTLNKSCIFPWKNNIKKKVVNNVGCSSSAPDGVLMTGSFNWTWKAVTSNNENVLITNDPQIVWQFTKEFEKNWITAASTKVSN